MPLTSPTARPAGGSDRGAVPAPRPAGPATAVFRPTGGTGAGAPAREPRPLPWLLGGVGAVALVALGGWLLVLAPQAAASDALQEQTAQTVANEAQLTTRVAELQAQFSDLPQYQADLARLRTQVPSDADLSQLLRELRDAAAAAGASLTSVVPAAPVPATAATDAAPAEATATDGASPAADGTTAAADTTTATATASTATSTDPSTGLVRIPLTITATGSYAAVQAFLAAVQEQDRLVLLTSVSFAPGASASGSADLTLTASGSVFALPATDADGASATSVPTSAPTSVPTAGATALPTAVPTTAPTS